MSNNASRDQVELLMLACLTLAEEIVRLRKWAEKVGDGIGSIGHRVGSWSASRGASKIEHHTGVLLAEFGIGDGSTFGAPSTAPGNQAANGDMVEIVRGAFSAVQQLSDGEKEKNQMRCTPYKQGKPITRKVPEAPRQVLAWLIATYDFEPETVERIRKALKVG